jgi:hypothetical protein
MKKGETREPQKSCGGMVKVRVELGKMERRMWI